MRNIPDCLNRRYKALDDLVHDLTTMYTDDNGTDGSSEINARDPGVKLMCDLWNILKEDSDGNITQTVNNRIGVGEKPKSNLFGSRHTFCYVSRKDCCKKPQREKSVESRGSKKSCCKSATTSPSGTDSIPLSQVLFNLKEAASFDKKCNEKIDQLLKTQTELQEQVAKLEDRERDGAQMLKQADCMWSCMEDCYKKKLAEITKNQMELTKQLKEVEKSNAKWRKNERDLELQMVDLKKCHNEIIDKTNQKRNDLKCVEGEIADMEKRIISIRKETEGAQNSLSTKKTAGDANVAKHVAEVSRLQALLNEETKIKHNKEQEGNKLVRLAREELQKLCTAHLTKKLENEDLRNEKEALTQEIRLLREAYDTCKDKCNNKKAAIKEEIKKIDKEIAGFKNQCIRCHQCTDTIDVRKLCTDCPRCLKARECKLDKDHCIPDPTMDCVCMATKRKFLDNVFDNMYTVLARQSKSNPGKAISEQILKDLKRSKNGKLSGETKQLVQDFILTTVKNNLNLTIIGGAVKTRCEMDADTYKQLMLCIDKATVAKPTKEDKGTIAKKEPCRRWGGASECNCPKGPKYCICSRKAPPPVNDPTPCPPQQDDIKEADSTVCPHKSSPAPCGVECGARSPSREWSRAPCAPTPPCTSPGSPGPACLGGNVRAAQCSLGPDALQPKTNTKRVTLMDDCDYISPCKCNKSDKYSTFKSDGSSTSRDRIIKEVIGNYKDYYNETVDEDFDVNYYPKMDNNMSISKTNLCDCTSDWYLIQNTDDLIQMIEQKGNKNKECVFSIKNMENLGVEISTERPKNDAQPELTVILEPKFQADENSQIKKSDSKGKAKIIGKSENKDVIDEIKGTKICDVVTELLNDVIVPNNYEKYEGGSDIELMTIESLIKKLSPRHIGEENQTTTVDENSKKLNACQVKCNKDTCTSETSVILLDDVEYDDINMSDIESDIKKQFRVAFDESNTSYHSNYTKSVHETDSSGTENVSKRKNKKQFIRDPKVINEELNKKYKQNKLITIKVRGDVSKQIKVPVTKTPSGHIAIDAEMISSVCNIENGKCSVALSQTSGKYILDIRPTKANAVLKKSTGKYLIVVQSNKHDAACSPTESIFELNIKNSKYTLHEVPCILKRTPSDNYTIVIDKEYEKRFMQIISDIMQNKTSCSIQLQRTSSDKYEIEVNDSKDAINEAILLKSESGNIKIIPNKSLEKLDKNMCLDNGNTVISELLDQLSKPYNKDDSSNLKTASIVKSSSDSMVYEHVKILSPDNKLLLQPPAVLTRTDSGQYTIVLDKASKKKFIDNLKDFLSIHSSGVVPIKKTDTGDILIDLNNDKKSKGKQGSLKITQSGNIYIIMDTDFADRFTKDMPDSPNNFRSVEIIKNIGKPIDKAVVTTCNAMKDSRCDCDFSKCVCKELENMNFEQIFIDDSKTSNVTVLRSENFEIKWNKGAKNDLVKSKNELSKVMEQNVYYDDLDSEVNSDLYSVDSVNEDHCFYYITALGQGKNDNQTSKRVEFENRINIGWDAIENMPPQLPKFLKDIVH